MLASDISYKHVGKTFRSLTYASRNKTEKPKITLKEIGPDGKFLWVREARHWTLRSFQFFDNGNIIINQGEHYLRPDTEVEIVDGND